MRYRLSLLLAIVFAVACQESPVAPQHAVGSVRAGKVKPFAPTTTPYIFKVQLNNGTWYKLNKTNDRIVYDGTHDCGTNRKSFLIVSSGVSRGYVCRDSIKTDTGGLNNWNQYTGGGLANFNMFSIGSVGPTSGDYIKDTGTDVNGNPTWDISSGGATNSYTQDQIPNDGGPFRFDACNVAPIAPC